MKRGAATTVSAGGSATSQATGSSGGGGGGNSPTNATAFTDADGIALRQQMNSVYTPRVEHARRKYISNTNFDGQKHSLSQTMNYLLDNGVDIDNATPNDLKKIKRQFGVSLGPGRLSQMQNTHKVMQTAYHPIGKDAKLQRGCHDDLLRNTFGISDYTTMSEKQLQRRLVGKAFKNTSPMSTSYDISKNPFLSPTAKASGGREVILNISAGKNTKMIFGARKQSEIVLADGTNWRITGVRYTGKTAHPRNGLPKKQIQIDIETF